MEYTKMLYHANKYTKLLKNKIVSVAIGDYMRIITVKNNMSQFAKKHIQPNIFKQEYLGVPYKAEDDGNN